jgi:hypothetical protein
MYQATLSSALHCLVARLERQGLDAWRLAHYPTESLDDALAQGCNEVLVRISRKLGGNITVTVSVVSPRPLLSDAFFFRLRKARCGTYEVIESSATLD